MEVILAKSAGFCFGVKRAVEKVYEQIEKGEPPIYTYGPLIHNEEVVADLERRDVKVIEEEHLEDVQAGTVIIRSHGVNRRVQEQMEQQGLPIAE